ncbi:hypothetical protein LI328DRAFT_162205 [Trichoderma asperelloides]|nr:hypothetical protein LI328DRAFT_162205 [Trichoderma asperelloides]
MNSVEEFVQGTQFTDTDYMTRYRLAFWEDQGYVQALAEHLFESIRIDWLTADQDTRTRVAAILPNLLKGFASRIRYDTEYLIHQDITVFIDDHSCEISAECLNTRFKQDKKDADKTWLFVFNTRASAWLLTQLQREFRLVSTEPNIIQGIQDTIMYSLLPAHHYSEPQNYAVVFEFECDLHRPGEGFKAAFTMTGSDLNVQGATCGNYIHQTWPLTGRAIIELVRGALCVQQGNVFKKTMPDGTKLSASIDESTGKLTVEAYGSAVSVAELGEQLAWLGAAVRALPLENDKITYCVPVMIKDLGSGNVNMTPHSLILQPSLRKVNFKIIFEMEETSATRLNRRCIIVKGYPISRRNVWREYGYPDQCDVMIGTDYWNRSIEKLCLREFLFHQKFM